MQSQTSDGPGVIERLEKLERQNRQMRLAGIVVLIVAAAVVLMGQAPATRTVEANKFVLLDDAGKMRGLFDVDLAGPQLLLFDMEGFAKIHLGMNSNGTARLRLSDKEGFQVAVGGSDLITPSTGETHETSAASVVLFDKDKKVLWKAP